MGVHTYAISTIFLITRDMHVAASFRLRVSMYRRLERPQLRDRYRWLRREGEATLCCAHHTVRYTCQPERARLVCWQLATLTITNAPDSCVGN